MDFKIKLLLATIIILTSWLSTTNGGDFDVYLQASRQLLAAQNIYAPPFIRDLQYYYSVFFALILSPFSRYVAITEFFWLLFSYALLGRIGLLISRYFNTEHLSKIQQRNWITLTLFLSLQFIMYEISLIQVTIFLLWAILEAIRLVEEKHSLIGGILLGTAINIKIMPILMLPYLFYRGYFRAIIVCMLTFLVLLYLPAIFIGYNYNSFLLSEWWKIINPTNKEHLFETGIGTHSIVALLPVYLSQTTADMDMPFRRNLFNLDHKTVELIIHLTRLFLLALALFFFKTLPFKQENNVTKRFWEIAYFLLLIPLLLPHQQKYNFLLVMPMVAYLLYFFIVTQKPNQDKCYSFAKYLFIFSVLIFSPLYGSDVIGTFLFRYTQHYRLLTICTIFLIPIALYCRPTLLIRHQSNITPS